MTYDFEIKFSSKLEDKLEDDCAMLKAIETLNKNLSKGYVLEQKFREYGPFNSDEPPKRVWGYKLVKKKESILDIINKDL